MWTNHAKIGKENSHLDPCNYPKDTRRCSDVESASMTFFFLTFFFRISYTYTFIIHIQYTVQNKKEHDYT